MRLTLRSRKSIGDLTAGDLQAFPIWEWTLDEEGRKGQDETFVRPVKGGTVRLNWEERHVAADFQAADGTSYEGIVTLTEDGVETGALLLPSGMLSIPYDHEPKSARKKFARSLGRSEKAVYPVAFTLRVPFSGEKTPHAGRFP